MAAAQKEDIAFAQLCKQVIKAILGNTAFPGSAILSAPKFELLSRRLRVFMSQNDILPQRKLFLKRASSWQTDGINIQVYPI
jgi:hypothetical protein